MNKAGSAEFLTLIETIIMLMVKGPGAGGHQQIVVQRSFYK